VKNVETQIPEEAKFACPHCGTLLEQPANAMNIKSHLAIAIIATLLCCVPLGIVSIIYATKVSQLVSLGKIAEAQEASKKIIEGFVEINDSERRILSKKIGTMFC